MKEPKEVVIIVHGGMVTDVFSRDSEIIARVLDLDTQDEDLLASYMEERGDIIVNIPNKWNAIY